MGDIGPIRRRIVVEPLEEPVTAPDPATVPAEPNVPATPEREPVPA